MALNTDDTLPAGSYFVSPFWNGNTKMFPAPSAASGDPPFDMIVSFSQRTAPVMRSRLISLPPAAVQAPEAVTTIPPRVPQKVPGPYESLQRMSPAGPSFSVWTPWG